MTQKQRRSDSRTWQRSGNITRLLVQRLTAFSFVSQHDGGGKSPTRPQIGAQCGKKLTSNDKVASLSPKESESHKRFRVSEFPGLEKRDPPTPPHPPSITPAVVESELPSSPGSPTHSVFPLRTRRPSVKNLCWNTMDGSDTDWAGRSRLETFTGSHRKQKGFILAGEIVSSG